MPLIDQLRKSIAEAAANVGLVINEFGASPSAGGSDRQPSSGHFPVPSSSSGAITPSGTGGPSPGSGGGGGGGGSGTGENGSGSDGGGNGGEPGGGPFRVGGASTVLCPNCGTTLTLALYNVTHGVFQCPLCALASQSVLAPTSEQRLAGLGRAPPMLPSPTLTLGCNTGGHRWDASKAVDLSGNSWHSGKLRIGCSPRNDGVSIVAKISVAGAAVSALVCPPPNVVAIVVMF